MEIYSQRQNHSSEYNNTYRLLGFRHPTHHLKICGESGGSAIHDYTLTSVLYIMCLRRKRWDNNCSNHNLILKSSEDRRREKQTFKLALMLVSTKHPALLS